MKKLFDLYHKAITVLHSVAILPSQKMKLKTYAAAELPERISFLRQESPLVSIVIPVYNQWEFTYACLYSIYRTASDIPYEIIIADDGSSDETRNIGEHVDNVVVIRNSKNLGFLKNCNNAASHARGKYIVFLNNDTTIQPGCFQALLETFSFAGNVGMVGPKLVYPDGSLQEAGGIIWDDASGWNFGNRDNPMKLEYNYVKEADYISGACIMLPRTLWLEIGGFDELFTPAYYEDVDLAFQVRERNLVVLYQPAAVVVHHEGASHGTDVKTGVKKHQEINRDKFLEKWGRVLKSDHFQPGVDVFLAREHGRKSKLILVADGSIPRFDTNAGERCSYNYMQLFRKLGYRVKFLANSHYLKQPYAGILQQHGIEVVLGKWYLKTTGSWLQQYTRYFSAVYLQRPETATRYIGLIQASGKPKVFYFPVDLHHIRMLRQSEIEGKASLRKDAEKFRKIDEEIIRKSDVVHVVGDYEYAYLRDHFPGKTVRNIPVYLYETFDDPRPASELRNRNNLLFVGNFDHAPNVDAVRWFVERIFPGVASRIPGVKLFIVGANPPRQIRSLQGDAITVTGYVSDEKLNEYYRQCRLHVVPLRYGAGVKGKVIEGMYHQIPVVSTPIGVEGLGAVEGCIAVADGEEGLRNMIVELYGDPDRLQSLRENAIRLVREQYSVEKALALLRDDLQ